MIENQVKEMKIKSTILYILLILSRFLSAKAQKFDNIDTKGNSIHSIFRLYFQQKILPLQYWNLQTILVFKKKNPQMLYRHSGNCYKNGNLKSETRKALHPSPPFTTLHLNLKDAFSLKTYYEGLNWSPIKVSSGLNRRL